MFLSIIIPVYNESRQIEGTLKKVHQFFISKNFDFEIIVVDDGSSDETAGLVLNLAKLLSGVQLIRLPRNIGKGGAVKAGALVARGKWILFLDADLSTAPEEFDKFVSLMPNYDIIIGSRAMVGAVIKVHQSWWRENVGRWLNVILRLWLGLPFRDTQCGFKLFNQKTKPLFSEQRLAGWLFDAELLYLASRQKFKIKEVPIVWSHDPTSTVRLVQTFDILRDLWRIKKLHVK